MVKYVITGGSGWLGMNLIETLLNGNSDFKNVKPLKKHEIIRVLCFNNEVDTLTKNFGDVVEPIVGDVRDIRSLQKLFSGVEGAILIHTAAVIHPKRFYREFLEVNLTGTRNVVEQACVSRTSKIVVNSSNSINGCNPNQDHVFTEDSPNNPYMGYGKSKELMELYLHKCIASGNYPPIAIIRAPWFYGPHQPARQTKFFSMIKAGRFPIVGSGENRRSMVYMSNLVQGVLLAASLKAANNETFWVADRRPYSMNDIVKTVQTVLREDFSMSTATNTTRVPGFISDCAWLADTIIQSSGLYNKELHVLSEMNKTIACNTSKAEKFLGFSPTIELREGMRRSIQWCQNNGMQI